MIALLLAGALSLSTPDVTCRVRDKAGKVVRSMSRRNAFMRATGYPNGRPGWIVDHLVSLQCGGCDLASNMTWQTVAEAKAKDRWEGQCSSWWDGTNVRRMAR